MALVIHIDGGARGNPGPAGAGVLIRGEDGSPVHEAGYYIGRQTNNAAEYTALVYALRRAIESGADAVTIYSDSELLVQQMTGEYRVKNANLSKLHAEAQKLLLKIDAWTIRHIRREQNRRADQLVNMAIDKVADVIIYDASRAEFAEGPARESGHDTTAEGDNEPPPSPAPGAFEAEDSDASTGRSRKSSGSENSGRNRRGGDHEKLGQFTFEPGDAHAVRVVVSSSPDPDDCPARGCGFVELTLAHTLPSGVCLHAAHALLPTILAVQNTDTREFAAIPTITVRCLKAGCEARFQLSPVAPANGSGRRGDKAS